MSWIRLDSGVSHHPKILELADALSVSRREARGIVLALWDFCMLSAQDGHLGAIQPRRLARVCDWDGDPYQLADALVESELLDRVGDSFKVHGWSERTGSWQEAQKKAQSRKRVRDNPGQSETVRDSPGLSRTPPSYPSSSSSFSGSSSSEGESERESETLPSHEGDRVLDALLDWWRWETTPDWCPAPRRTGRLASRFPEVLRLAAQHQPEVATPLEAVQRYVTRAWSNAWVAEQRLGGQWLLGVDAKAADTDELEQRIVRVLDGVGAEPKTIRLKGQTQAQQAFDELERLEAEERAKATGPPRGALRLASGDNERRARWVRGGEA